MRAARSYVLGERLGSGGMGVVYAATCAVRGHEVAVKFLDPARARDPHARRRFVGEAQAGRLVSHPNVVAVLDAGETADGDPFYVMERLRGEPLGARIARDGVISPDRALLITRQILAGLASMHLAGVVHGDIKSDNVVIETGPDGADRCKLIDFGLASVQFAARRPGDPPPMHDDWLSGTPDYMAPEVIRGEGSSFGADLYAVGIILYELLTGRPPFAGGTASEIVERHLEDEIVPPSLRCTAYDLPVELDRIVLRALEKEPALRYRSAEELAAALSQLARDLDASSWTLAAGTPMPTPRASEGTESITIVGSQRPRGEVTPLPAPPTAAVRRRR